MGQKQMFSTMPTGLFQSGWLNIKPIFGYLARPYPGMIRPWQSGWDLLKPMPTAVAEEMSNPGFHDPATEENNGCVISKRPLATLH